MDDVGKIIMIIAIIIAVIAVIGAVIRYIYFYKKEHFECPHCGNKFKPKVFNMIFSVNAVEGKIITCPKCGEKEYMEPKKDKYAQREKHRHGQSCADVLVLDYSKISFMNFTISFMHFL